MTEEATKKLLIVTMGLAAVLVLFMIINLPKMPSDLPVDESTLDTDGDGIPNGVEQAIGTDIARKDTDGDGFEDLVEIKKGFNPLDKAASGQLGKEDFAILKGKIQDADPAFYKANF